MVIKNVYGESEPVFRRTHACAESFAKHSLDEFNMCVASKEVNHGENIHRGESVRSGHTTVSEYYFLLVCSV